VTAHIPGRYYRHQLECQALIAHDISLADRICRTNKSKNRIAFLVQNKTTLKLKRILYKFNIILILFSIIDITENCLYILEEEIENSL